MKNKKLQGNIEQTLELISSGYAGILPNGNIVDRREVPEAFPIQKNSMFNVPEVKPISSKRKRHND